MKITVETTVKAPIEKVWAAWNNAEAIKQWNAASDDWHTTAASVDLRVGGVFSSRMEAKDGSMGFDFEGTYTQVIPQQLIEYALGDERQVKVEFQAQGNETLVRETFDAENVHPAEMQRAGWQSILERFARYVESQL